MIGEQNKQTNKNDIEIVEQFKSMKYKVNEWWYGNVYSIIIIIIGSGYYVLFFEVNYLFNSNKSNVYGNQFWIWWSLSSSWWWSSVGYLCYENKLKKQNVIKSIDWIWKWRQHKMIVFKRSKDTDLPNKFIKTQKKISCCFFDQFFLIILIYL